MKRLRRSFFPAICSSLLLLSLTFNLIAQQTPNTAEQLAAARRDVDSVVMDVTVTDKVGNFVDGLDKTAFAIYENNVPQPITVFAQVDEPMSIGIIFDLSGSVTDSKSLKLAHQAVLRFIKLSNSANDYLVIGFADRPLVLIDWTRDSKAVAEQLSRYNFTTKNAKGISLDTEITALYDAFYLGIEKMESGAHSKRAILLITDGQDTKSLYKRSEVRARLKETDVILYSIVISKDDDNNGRNIFFDLDSLNGLRGLSAVSGGAAYFPIGVKEIDAVFDSLAVELRHQYVLGFKPSKDKADGKWHQIKIKMTPPRTAKGKKRSVYARSRESYYAVKNLR